jgi:hypothetical protein
LVASCNATFKIWKLRGMVPCAQKNGNIHQ